jgi:hypothetical protein
MTKIKKKLKKEINKNNYKIERKKERKISKSKIGLFSTDEKKTTNHLFFLLVLLEQCVVNVFPENREHQSL